MYVVSLKCFTSFCYRLCLLVIETLSNEFCGIYQCRWSIIVVKCTHSTHKNIVFRCSSSFIIVSRVDKIDWKSSTKKRQRLDGHTRKLMVTRSFSRSGRSDRKRKYFFLTKICTRNRETYIYFSSE